METISKIVSHYSLCKSIIQSDRLVKKAKEKGIKTLISSDINSLSGAIDFMQECDKEKVKWIIGVTLDTVGYQMGPQIIGNIATGEVEPTLNKAGTITLLAKNIKGWKLLLKIVSEANTEEFFVDHPQIGMDAIEEIVRGTNDLIVLTGGYNSRLAHLMINHEARFASFDEEVKPYIGPNWTYNCAEELIDLKRAFGEDNVYLEVSREYSAITRMLNKGVRYLAKQTNTKCLPSNPIHYLDEGDWMDHHLMMCIGRNIKKSQLREIKDVEEYPFICGPNFSLNTSDDGFSKEEIENINKLVEQCETYKVFSNPRLPEFKWRTNGTSESEYLRELCLNGWKKKIEGKLSKEKEKTYSDRVKEELDIVAQVDDIIKEPLLSRYFLITQDYANYAKNNEIGIGPGRGSSGGCMVAYLTNITEIDPIENELFFSRFFNTGRINKDKFSLPDIDLDFEINKREDIIRYITEKYGKDNVGQVATFGREQGRGALRDVLRINEACTMDEINKITSFIPDEAKIADDLQEMKDEGKQVSIILWALQNNKDKLSKWCYLDDKGNFQGEYARLFEQAVRLEGTLKVMGKHAAAVVISAEPLREVCPVLHNKNGEELLAGFEYVVLESLGVLKCDILGVAALDKISETKRLIKEMIDV